MNIEKYISNIKTTPRNIEFLHKYHKFSVLKNLSVARIRKKFLCLKVIAIDLGGDFDKTSQSDIENWYINLKNKGYSNSTVRDYCEILKGFYRWLEGGNKTYPAKVEWIYVKTPRSNVEPGDIITDDEFDRIIAACMNLRDKAYFKFLRETGARVGETLSMKIKNIEFTDKNAVVRFPAGKTGPRTIMILASIAALKDWLKQHPDSNNPEAWLWTELKEPVLWDHDAIRMSLNKICRRAKIKRRIYPHLFRHTCASELAKKGWTESEMELFLGWVHGSRMPATYIHLTGRDIDRKVMERYGLKTEGKELGPLVIRCPNCGTINEAKEKICQECRMTLDLKEAQAMMNAAKNAGLLDESIQWILKEPALYKMFRQILEKIERKKENK